MTLDNDIKNQQISFYLDNSKHRVDENEFIYWYGFFKRALR